jgi:hypothetical protein
MVKHSEYLAFGSLVLVVIAAWVALGAFILTGLYVMRLKAPPVAIGVVALVPLAYSVGRLKLNGR